MIHSGDAAEQMVRLSLEGVEVAAKITGKAAKEMALLLIAALHNQNKKLKLKGKARLASMLKSGKALEIFSIKEGDLQNFMRGAKQYGIVYSVLRKKDNKADGLCEVMVRADDAPKISRVCERFKFGTVDKARIESELVAAKSEKAAGAEPGAPDVGDTEKLLDDLLGTPEGQRDVAPNIAHGAGRGDEPIRDRKEPIDSAPFVHGGPPQPHHPSEPTSVSRSKPERATSGKPSVREELREIKAARTVQETDAPKRKERQAADKPPSNRQTTHQQPPRGNSKSKKSRGSR